MSAVLSPYIAVTSMVHDALINDQCLMDLLEPIDSTKSYGADDDCDEPIWQRAGRPIREYEQPFPGAFSKAIVCFGRFGVSPVSVTGPGNREDWQFLAGAWAQKQVVDGGSTYTGSDWAGQVFDNLRRILAWSQERVCAGGIAVYQRQQDGMVEQLTFDTEHGIWRVIGQFRWTVVARGLRAPARGCC